MKCFTVGGTVVADGAAPDVERCVEERGACTDEPDGEFDCEANEEDCNECADAAANEDPYELKTLLSSG